MEDYCVSHLTPIKLGLNFGIIKRFRLQPFKTDWQTALKTLRIKKQRTNYQSFTKPALQ